MGELNIPFTFPVSLEDFLAYQEELTGHGTPSRVREPVDAWLQLINAAYIYGLEADDLVEMEQLISMSVGKPAVHRFLRCIKRWMIYANEQRKNENFD